MKTTQQNSKRAGFTLIEMVGVLAVIAILAALLVPKIFAAIEESRYTNTIGSINAVKAATMGYFSRNGGFTASTTFDTVLIGAGELERPFTSRIGTDHACAAVVASGDATAGLGRYDLDGDETPDITSQTVVQVKLENVNAADALELSRRIDGTNMSAVADTGGPGTADDKTDLQTPDEKGRCVYAAPDGTTGKTTVYVYLAHK